MEGNEENSYSIGRGKAILIMLLAMVILIVSQVVALLAGGFAVGTLRMPAVAGQLISAILYILFTVSGIGVLSKKMLKIPLKYYRITKVHVEPIWVLSAFVMPVLVSGILLLTKGHWENNSMEFKEMAEIVAEAVCFYGLATGIVEEMVFRGVFMGMLEQLFNKWVAIIVPSVIFGFVHIIGNQLDFLSIVQLLIAGSMAGILFSVVTYESGSVWSSAVMHGVWNIVMIGGILHIGVSAEETCIFNYILDTESFLISGGDFGVEASIFAIIAYWSFSILALYRYKKKQI